MDKIKYRNHIIEIEYSFGGGIILYIHRININNNSIKIPYVLLPKLNKLIKGKENNVYSNISNIDWNEVDKIIDDLYIEYKKLIQST